MLTRVDVQNIRGGTLQLPLAASAPGYILTDIEGLGPVKAALTSTSLAQIDGALPQAARRDTRNITAKIQFAPDFSTNTVQNLRRNLYSYLLPKSSVSLLFYFDGTLYAKSSATVEDLDDTRFTATPEMDLSLICYDPDFYAPAAETTSLSTVTTTTTHTFNYEGSSDTGIVLTLTANAALTGFTVYNTTQDGTQQKLILSGMSLVSGDTLTITSVPGQKSIIQNHSGVKTSQLFAMDPTSTWPMFKPGTNNLRVLAGSAGIPYTVSYVAKYAGL